MPLGKVFDAREGAVQFDPIGSARAGRAMRADITLREKQAEALQMEMDSAPAAAAAARRKEQRDIDKAKRLQEKAERDVAESQRQIGKDRTEDIAEASAAYYLKTEDKGSEEEASDIFWNTLGQRGWDQETIEKMRLSIDENGNGIIDKKEAEGMKYFGVAHETMKARAKAKEDYTLAPGAQRRDKNDQIVATNPKAADISVDVGDSVRLAENFTSDSIKKYEEELSKGNLDSSLLKPLLDPDEDAGEIAAQLDNATKLIDDAIALASNVTTGVPGMWKRMWETGDGYLDPNAEQPAKDFSEKVMLLQATNWREIVGAGQLSKADYVFLDGLFKGKGWLDDPVSTKRSLNLLKGWLNSKKAISGALDSGGMYKRARDAIAAGADVDAVKKRIEENGGDPSKL